MVASGGTHISRGKLVSCAGALPATGRGVVQVTTVERLEALVYCGRR